MPEICTIIHEIPGRVRLRVDNKAACRSLGGVLTEFVRGLSGVESVRLNSRCASVTVSFEPRRVTPRSLVAELTNFLETRLASFKAFHADAESSHSRVRARKKHGQPSRGTTGAAGFLRRSADENLTPSPYPLPRCAGREGTNESAGRLTSSEEPPRGDLAIRSIAGCDEEDPRGERELCWFQIDPEDVAESLGSDRERGLTPKAATDRLTACGANSLGKIKEASGWRTLVNQFTSLPVGLLLGSAVVSVGTGGLADAAVILGVVAINACIGCMTECQARRTIASLEEESTLSPTVIRDGRRQPCDLEAIVPGDLVVLTPGTTVCADLRLLEAKDLMIDESVLTGESLPVLKSPRRLDELVVLRSRRNMAYRGTTVAGGSGLGMVVETGLNTEVGQIQSLVEAAEAPETPVQRQLNALGTKLGILTGFICVGVFGIGLIRRYGMVRMLKSSTSLAVAAVPEGLPMVATTTLALGVRQLRRKNVVVRRLDAVETLGSVQVFCLDKTGTLTRNQMRVVRVGATNQSFDVDSDTVHRYAESVDIQGHAAMRRLIEAAVLCNEANVCEDNGVRTLDGSPTEAALLHLALDLGIDVCQVRRRYPAIATEYRGERRGYMTTVHDVDATTQLVAVKGRPRDVLEQCRWQFTDDGPEVLSDKDRAAIRAENERMAGKALRVLGFAFREGPRPIDRANGDLVWLGLTGIADPIRPGMCELMQTFHNAGIRTTMITGDQSATAHAIGRELQLSGKPLLKTVDSAELEQLDPEVLKSLAQNVHVFSSVSPSHKLGIVQALQRAGEIVAMTGDGINDGPALKAADIGVAMGGDGSTEVARMTADVVLQDNNLHTMVAAIRQGRTIYSNTRNAIRFLLSTNMSEIIVMSLGVASGAGEPLNPMQLLWLNLVSDIFPVLAIAVQPPEDDVLQQPPRDANEPFLDAHELKQLLIQSTIISAGTFGSYAWGRYRHGATGPASTMAFMSITAAQLLHILSFRSDRHSIFSNQRSPMNGLLMLALLGGFGLQFITMTIPSLRRLLRNTPLSPNDALVSLLGAGLPFLIDEARKEWRSVALENKTSDEDTTTLAGTRP